jgi:hypothetical protein
MQGKPTINKEYPFQVWISTLFLAPIIFLGEILITDSGSIEVDMTSCLFVISWLLGSFLVSIPAFGPYYYIFNYVDDKKFTTWRFKLLMCLVAIICMMGTILIAFIIEEQSFDASTILDFLELYGIPIVITSLCYKIKKPGRLPETDGKENLQSPS